MATIRARKSNTPAVIRETITAAEKAHGKGSLMVLGDDGDGGREVVEVIRTGSLGLDRALGIGGLARGRIVELFGPEMSGKSTLALSVGAEIHRSSPTDFVGVVDAEHALDRNYCVALGLDPKRTLLSQPDCGEEGLSNVERMIAAGLPFVMIDSVAALVPKAEIDGDMDAVNVGLQARLIAKAMRKLTAMAAKGKTTLLFINQLREKIGVAWGNPETTPGGRALKFHSSVRLDIRRIAAVKNGNATVGNHVRVRVVKNKLAPPLLETEFNILFGVGIDRAGEIIDLCKAAGVLTLAGSVYSFGKKRMATSRDAMVALLGDGRTEIAVELLAALEAAHLKAEGEAK